MVVLRESIRIDAPFERLLGWVRNFETEFVKWSPLHIECELLTGGTAKGGRIRFREIVMGLDYDVSGTITESEMGADHFRFRFLSDAKTAAITFEGWRDGNGLVFEHTEEFGLRASVIGPIINFLVFKVIYRKKADWKLIRDDMVLDNHYLKQILTTGKYPERDPAVDAMRGKKA